MKEITLQDLAILNALHELRASPTKSGRDAKDAEAHRRALMRRLSRAGRHAAKKFEDAAKSVQVAAQPDAG